MRGTLGPAVSASALTIRNSGAIRKRLSKNRTDGGFTRRRHTEQHRLKQRTSLLDRLLHHAVVIQIEGARYRWRGHADPGPKHVRTDGPIELPLPPKHRRNGP